MPAQVLGNFLFRRYLLSVSWYAIFTCTVGFAALASSLQLLLMFRNAEGLTLSEQLHMPAVAFARGWVDPYAVGPPCCT